MEVIIYLIILGLILMEQVKTFNKLWQNHAQLQVS